MREPQSLEALEKLGRIPLSPSFYMRDFLYSEIANFYGMPNIPENPDLAVANGKCLCETLLEPLNAAFGRLAIRSAYRSPTINALGNMLGHSCASNESNFAGHIWDVPDASGHHGAVACVVIPWFTKRYDDGADWRALAYWIHNHLPYSSLQFFPKLCAFNIGWHEQPKRTVRSYILEPSIQLADGMPPSSEYAHWYSDFPESLQKP
jgi:hypothetical protein